MWWVRKSGRVEGPYSDAQMRQKIALNMVRSLDKVSADRVAWEFAKNTSLWAREKPAAAAVEVPAPEARAAEIRAEAPAEPAAAARPRPRIGAGEAGPDERDFMPDGWRTEGREAARGPAADAGGRRKAIAVPACAAAAAAVAVAACAAVLFSGGGKAEKSAEKTAEKVAGKSVAKAIAKAVPAAATNAQAKVDWSAIRSKVAVVEMRESFGTGFLLRMDGKPYFVSNHHVLESAGAPKIRFADGRTLRLGRFYVAADGRDLARYEVLDAGVETLEYFSGTPDVGSPVVAFGNSLGQGVITEGRGVVQGVGPDAVETNAEFVQGNSGGPLVDGKGRVIGVNTALRRTETAKENWGNKNTRYDGAVRRFATRLNGARWKEIDRKKFQGQVARLREFEKFIEYLRPYIVFDCGFEVDKGDLVFNDLSAKDFGSGGGFAEELARLSDLYEKRQDAIELLERKAAALEAFHKTRSDRSEAEWLRIFDSSEAARAMSIEAARNMILGRKETLRFARTHLEELEWDSPRHRNGRDGKVDWHLAAIGTFADIMDQKLKDLNKTVRKIEKGSR